MQHISRADLYDFEDALESERRQLEKELSEHGRKSGNDWQGTSSGFETNEPDDVDEADKMEELATNVPLVETLEARLKDVTDALAKIQSGTYGMCEKNGEAIAHDRLRANPAARHCIEHSK